MSGKKIREHVEDGFLCCDYLLDNGCIVTIRTPQPRISLDEIVEQFGLQDVVDDWIANPPDGGVR